MNRFLITLLAASFAFTAMAALAGRDVCREATPSAAAANAGAVATCVPAPQRRA